LDPLRFEQPLGLEPGQERIDRALREHELRVALEPAENLEAVLLPGPERREDRQLQASLAELDLPLLHGIFGAGHGRYYVLQCIMLSIATSMSCRKPWPRGRHELEAGLARSDRRSDGRGHQPLV